MYFLSKLFAYFVVHSASRVNSLSVLGLIGSLLGIVCLFAAAIILFWIASFFS